MSARKESGFMGDWYHRTMKSSIFGALIHEAELRSADPGGLREVIQESCNAQVRSTY